MTSSPLLPMLITLMLLAGGYVLAQTVSTPRADVVFKYNYCVTPEERERIRGVVLDALNRGLREHTQNLFLVMMRDPRDQPQRAITGMNPGVVAYVSASKTLRKWDPPLCEDGK